MCKYTVIYVKKTVKVHNNMCYLHIHVFINTYAYKTTPLWLILLHNDYLRGINIVGVYMHKTHTGYYLWARCYKMLQCIKNNVNM